MTELSDPVSRHYQGSVNVFDLAGFVNEVADRFEKSRRGGIRVSPAARDELVRRMKPHELELRNDLASGKMTSKELQRILAGVLGVANRVRSAARTKTMARRRVGRKAHESTASILLRYSQIDRRSVLIAMKWKCRYLGWC